MSTEFPPNDELCRIWQALGSPRSKEEAYQVMEMVQARVVRFDRTIYLRNVREYVAAAFVAVTFAVVAAKADAPLARLGYGIVSAAGVWISLFLWWMQRSAPAPLPEASGDAYREAVLAKYDRQIFLTRTAWAWYVLPFTAGLVIASLGNPHNPEFGQGMAAFMVAVGAAIAIMNRMAAKRLAAEKQDLQRLLED